jgi:hypothetical protein
MTITVFVLSDERVGLSFVNQNFNRDGGLILSRGWHPVINMLPNQEAGLTQQTLDTNLQLPPGADCFSRHIGLRPFK